MSVENLGQYLSTIEDPRCSGKVERSTPSSCYSVIRRRSWPSMGRHGKRTSSQAVVPLSALVQADWH